MFMYYKTYLDWLKNIVEYFDTPIPHNALLERLYQNTFSPSMERDLNRAADGIALRDEAPRLLIPETSIDSIDSPCSFLEFLIALARRMNYIYAMPDEDRTQDCFWTLLGNLGLSDLDDRVYSPLNGDAVVDEALDAVNRRTFQQDGSGGLFPLEHPRTNQRNVEIWYQMNQYMIEVLKNEGRM